MCWCFAMLSDACSSCVVRQSSDMACLAPHAPCFLQVRRAWPHPSTHCSRASMSCLADECHRSACHPSARATYSLIQTTLLPCRYAFIPYGHIQQLTQAETAADADAGQHARTDAAAASADFPQGPARGAAAGASPQPMEAEAGPEAGAREKFVYNFEEPDGLASFWDDLHAQVREHLG